METETTISSGDLIDSREVAAMLGVTQNNLRQIVSRKELAVQERQKRRSMFLREDVQRLHQLREQKRQRKSAQS